VTAHASLSTNSWIEGMMLMAGERIILKAGSIPAASIYISTTYEQMLTIFWSTLGMFGHGLVNILVNIFTP
jgi:hypothetical protein